jgi:hypothetical protein
VKPEGWLLCPPQPAICSCHKSDNPVCAFWSTPSTYKQTLSSCFPTKILYIFLFSPLCATLPSCPILDLIMLLIVSSTNGEALYFAVFISLLLIPSLGPVLELPPHVYFGSLRRPVCTPVQNSGQNCSSVFLNLWLFTLLHLVQSSSTLWCRGI